MRCPAVVPEPILIAPTRAVVNDCRSLGRGAHGHYCNADQQLEKTLFEARTSDGHLIRQHIYRRGQARLSYYSKSFLVYKVPVLADELVNAALRSLCHIRLDLLGKTLHRWQSSSGHVSQKRILVDEQRSIEPDSRLDSSSVWKLGIRWCQRCRCWLACASQAISQYSLSAMTASWQLWRHNLQCLFSNRWARGI